MIVRPHPHPDLMHVVRQYRRHILSTKRKYGTARVLVHYRAYVQCYVKCKREVLRRD